MQSADDALIMKASMQALRERLDSNLKIGPKTLRSIGNEFGLETAGKMTANNLDGLVEELASYWEKNDIGLIEWIDRSNRFLRMEEISPKLSSCAVDQELIPFRRGYLEAVLKARLGSSFTVTEFRPVGRKTGSVFRIDSFPD